MTARHVYVHVPFCGRRCTYCDFSIAVRRRVPIGAYLDALAREAARQGVPEAPATLYLGGGTPSLLGGEGVAAVARLFGPGAGHGEFTVEANPEDVTAVAACAWVAAGVNRLSLGAQSFDDRVLRWMHRTHDAAAIPRAVRAARAAGLGNVSLDLMFALPEVLQRDFGADLAAAIALEPDHVSLYGLTVEAGTPLARGMARGEVAAVGEGRYAEEYLLAHQRLAAAGFRFYELSNAARPGREAVHNRAYWELRPYLGFGPSAHSFNGTTRWWNEPAYAAWARLLADGRSPVVGREVLAEPQRRLEQLYLGLRTVEGIELTAGNGNGGSGIGGLREETVRAWVRAGWAVMSPAAGHPGQSSQLLRPEHPAPSPRLSLTPTGWLRLDALVASL